MKNIYLDRENVLVMMDQFKEAIVNLRSHHFDSCCETIELDRLRKVIKLLQQSSMDSVKEDNSMYVQGYVDALNEIVDELKDQGYVILL